MIGVGLDGLKRETCISDELGWKLKNIKKVQLILHPFNN